MVLVKALINSIVICRESHLLDVVFGAYITHFTNGSQDIIFYWHSGWDDNVLHFTNERYLITS